MVLKETKDTKGTIGFEDADIEDEDIKVTKKKKRIGELDYPKGFRKIASYSGTTRIMKCKGKCGEFDDIINIYIDPQGKVIDEYNVKDNKIINASKDNISVSAKKVQHKDLTFWGGKPREMTAEYRKKGKSKPVRRVRVPKGKR